MDLTATLFTSLDGVVQGPGGAQEDTRDGFDRGGWLAPLFDDDAGRFVTQSFEKADAFLLGRHTYDIFASYWPHQEDGDVVELALNRLPKHVVTSSPLDVAWNGARAIEGDLVDAVTELTAAPGRELQVHGSPTLLASLIGTGLLDELRLIVFPVVVGAGRRFVDGDAPLTGMELLDSQATGTGALLLRYRPTGPGRTADVTRS